MPCSVVTGRETWILSCLLLAAYTGEWWTVCFSTLHWQALIEQYAGQKAGLSVYHAVWMFTMNPWNHFIVCHSISPLIPLPLYLALVCIWIVRAVLRPPRPWNIVCCVILAWAEHSGSVFPIVLFFFFYKRCSPASWLHNTPLLYKLSVETFSTCKGWPCPHSRGSRPSFGE